jgi:hypothetical protein
MVVGMEVAGVVERAEHIAAVRANPVADAALIKSGLVAIREARAWLDAQQGGLVRSLRFIDSFAENTVADAAKQSLGKAAKTTERSNTPTRPRIWPTRWKTVRSPPNTSTRSPGHRRSSTVPSVTN